MTDSSEWDESARKREQFKDWLVQAWDYATDQHQPGIAAEVEKLLSRIDELDYPVWELAQEAGLVGSTGIAKTLRRACGVPDGPVATGWLSELNFAPTIYLDRQTWARVYGALGWVNRNQDPRVSGHSFWLRSDAGNMVRFVAREQESE